MKCKWYLCKQEAKPNSKWCGKRCSMKASVTRLRQERKQQAVDYKGGRCERCGYSKSLRALQFHHPDPTEKEFGIGSGNTKSWEKLKVELDKCELLCSNCHAEHHEQEYSDVIGNSLERVVKEIKGRPFCIDCNKQVQYGSTRCAGCASKRQEGIDWPDDTTLALMLESSTYSQVADQLGVAYSTLWKRVNNPRQSRKDYSTLS